MPKPSRSTTSALVARFSSLDVVSAKVLAEDSHGDAVTWGAFAKNNEEGERADTPFTAVGVVTSTKGVGEVGESRVAEGRLVSAAVVVVVVVEEEEEDGINVSKIEAAGAEGEGERAGATEGRIVFEGREAIGASTASKGTAGFGVGLTSAEGETESDTVLERLAREFKLDLEADRCGCKVSLVGVGSGFTSL